MQTIKIRNKHYASSLAEHFAGRGQIVMLQNVGSKMILTLEKWHNVVPTKSKSRGEKYHAVVYTFCSLGGRKK